MTTVATPSGDSQGSTPIGQWAAHLHDRLERLADLTGDPRVLVLRDEVGEHAREIASRPEEGGPTPPRVTDRSAQVMLPLHLRHPAGELRMYSTITHFGAAWDVTVSELSVETFVPADPATRTVLATLVP